MNFDLLKSLAKPAESKIVLLVMDGLGGLPREAGGLTELESARTPHLDELAKRSVGGLQQPVATGITSGSGPAHLALFGYDPIEYQVGRGVLSALGLGFELGDRDVAVRGNFCTVDEQGRVTDRRAGRLETERNRELCERLRAIELPGVEVQVETVKEYRFVLILRGDELSGAVSDTDPLGTGKKPLEASARSAEAEKTAELVNQFVAKAREALTGQSPANMILLRGLSKRPDWPSMAEACGLKAAAIAAYPMYRGAARLAGMQPLETGDSVPEEFAVLKKHWDDFDFFYLHVKRIDSAGEDGDFERKVSLIEEVDQQLPALLNLHPDVLVVTGDHSTPASLRAHSWHPVPVLLWSEHCRPDRVEQFGERACLAGGLGPRLPATDLLPLALANAGRLEKFGA